MNLSPSRKPLVLTPFPHISARGDVNRPDACGHDMLVDQIPQHSHSNHPPEREVIRGDACAGRGNAGGRIETECASGFGVDNVCLQRPPKPLSVLLIMLCQNIVRLDNSSVSAMLQQPTNGYGLCEVRKNTSKSGG
jgi:hypothetical protein